MNLALVHDWITTVGGAERVLFELHRMWPQAPIYTLLYNPRTVRRWLPDATVIASPLQRFPFRHRYYRFLGPLMPPSVESFDLGSYDTVLSSSVVFAKGVVVRPDTRHICYCYSPSRLLWDRAAAYERRGPVSAWYRHWLRSWDVAAAQRPDELLALSQTVAERISKYYRRSSIVVPPPCRDVTEGSPRLVPPGEYFLVVARMMPHKALDFVIDAFAKLRYRLVVVGDGPLRARLQLRAGGNITFTGWIPDVDLDGLYGGCRGVIVPNDEDWGLTAVESMMHGKPVLALRSGGATETVIEGITGEFFDDPIPEALADGMKRLRNGAGRYDPDVIRAHAVQYGTEQFRQRMRLIIEPTA